MFIRETEKQPKCLFSLPPGHPGEQASQGSASSSASDQSGERPRVWAATLTQGPSSRKHRTYPPRNQGSQSLQACVPRSIWWLHCLRSAYRGWEAGAHRQNKTDKPSEHPHSVGASGLSLLLRPSGNPALRSPAPWDAGKWLMVATRRGFHHPTFNASERWTIITARCGEIEILLYCWFNIN